MTMTLRSDTNASMVRPVRKLAPACLSRSKTVLMLTLRPTKINPVRTGRCPGRRQKDVTPSVGAVAGHGPISDCPRPEGGLFRASTGARATGPTDLSGERDPETLLVFKRYREIGCALGMERNFSCGDSHRWTVEE
jgi:hypothetical protein